METTKPIGDEYILITNAVMAEGTTIGTSDSSLTSVSSSVLRNGHSGNLQKQRDSCGPGEKDRRTYTMKIVLADTALGDGSALL